MSVALVVDDNAPNLMLFRHLLGKLDDVEAVCFDDPLAALLWCDTTIPDLVLLDYMMPGIDGLEFLRRFRARSGFADIPVVMVTADSEVTVRHQALQAGATDFLNKPIDKIELTARTQNLLAWRKSRVQLANRAQWLADEVRKATAEIAAREKEAILQLSRAAEYRDPETGAHLLRMSNYTRLIAGKMGLPEKEQQLLLEASPMHDIGKVGTPDAILLKPGRLDPEEFEIMKRHAEIGYEILSCSAAPLLRTAAQIALAHHEKFDGSGYPRGLAGDAIPLYGRIVAVADVFDALTSERPYKRAWPLEKAVEFLREGSGSHFDPHCVEAFLSSWDEVLAIHDRFQDEERQDPVL
jgi:putative two-component system response regulator